jgi:sugar phosphate isomerase/epimerase
VKKIISFVLVLLFCTVPYAQNKSTLIPQLYLSLSEYGPRMEGFISENNIQKMQYINDAQFFGKEPYSFDPKLLKQQVELAVPNPNSKGIVYIDIEGVYLDNIMNMGTQIDTFQKSIKLYIDVIKFAKKLRPNTKWGYYYIPYTTYWNRKPDFYGKLKKIEPLIKECDVFFPSLYNFYDDKDLAAENEKYVIENTKEMIKAGQYYKKPVIVFVWHRYHPSNDKLGMESLPEKVFLKHIERIVNTAYQGKKVDGIVWWGADDYFFRQKSKGVVKEFKGTDKEFVDYNDKIMLVKAKKVKTIIDSSN